GIPLAPSSVGSKETSSSLITNFKRNRTYCRSHIAGCCISNLKCSNLRLLFQSIDPSHHVNFSVLGPEGRKSVAPAARPGIAEAERIEAQRAERFIRIILRPWRGWAQSKSKTPALRPGLRSYGPPACTTKDLGSRILAANLLAVRRERNL